MENYGMSMAGEVITYYIRNAAVHNTFVGRVRENKINRVARTTRLVVSWKVDMLSQPESVKEV